MKAILCKFLFLFAPVVALGQFSSQGKILFERKTNIKLMYQTEEGNEWVKEYISKMAQYKIAEFSLAFNSENSNYIFDKEQEVKGETFTWGKEPARENKVFTDFKRKKVTSQKEVYEASYWIEDSITSFQWKIGDETRTIAGYHCRKATTHICDSVVVVAFYTEQLMLSGGPEGFNGLPGMILGLAIPRLYTTWFATQVDAGPQQIEAPKPAKKNRKVNNTELVEAIKKSTADWGKYGAKLLWWVTL